MHNQRILSSNSAQHTWFMDALSYWNNNPMHDWQQLLFQQRNNFLRRSVSW